LVLDCVLVFFHLAHQHGHRMAEDRAPQQGRHDSVVVPGEWHQTVRQGEVIERHGETIDGTVTMPSS